jgi:DNA primase
MPSPGARRLLAELVNRYHGQVDGAATYLASRGINRAAIDRFQLGFTGDNGEKTANRLTIPYLTPEGPWLIKYRCIANHNCKDIDHHAKYINDDGVDTYLFNAQVLRDAETVVLVEGEMDAVAVTMAGVPAVGYPGAQTWQKNRHWRWCFDSVDQLIIVADGDKPMKGKTTGVGQASAASIAADLRNSLAGIDVSIVEMPEGQDSNSYIHEHGMLDFLERIGLIDG